MRCWSCASLIKVVFKEHLKETINQTLGTVFTETYNVCLIYNLTLTLSFVGTLNTTKYKFIPWVLEGLSAATGCQHE